MVYDDSLIAPNWHWQCRHSPGNHRPGIQSNFLVGFSSRRPENATRSWPHEITANNINVDLLAGSSIYRAKACICNRMPNAPAAVMLPWVRYIYQYRLRFFFDRSQNQMRYKTKLDKQNWERHESICVWRSAKKHALIFDRWRAIDCIMPIEFRWWAMRNCE